MRTSRSIAREFSAKTALSFALSFAPSACTGGGSLSQGTAEPGRAVVQEAPVLPSSHPPVLTEDPLATSDHTGRAARRLSVDQLRVALESATGQRWLGRRSVDDPMNPRGRNEWWQQSSGRNVDMLEALGPTLGRADYRNTTIESLEPGVTFAKLAEDAARDACRAAIAQHTGAFAGAPEVHPDAANRAAIEAFLRRVALRFWARNDLRDEELGRLFELYRVAATASTPGATPSAMPRANTPADGWRAVCVALATDPQFLTY